MSSKFFARYSDSESESDEENSEEEQLQHVSKSTAYLDDSEDEVRVVRTEKDKREEELNQHVTLLHDHVVSKNFEKAASVLDAMIKSYNKAKLMFSRMGKNPGFFIKSLGQLEAFVKLHWESKEIKDKLSKNAAKDLALLRQKMRKYIEPFQEELADYRKNPSAYSDYVPPEERGSEDEDEDDGEEFTKVGKKNKGEEMKKKSHSKQGDTDDISDEDEDQDKSKPSSSGRTTETKQNSIKALFSDSPDITSTVVAAKIYEVIRMRGRRNNDKETLNIFEGMLKIIDDRKLDDALRVKLLMLIIPLKLDLSSSGIDVALRPDAFKFMLDRLKKLSLLLVSHPTYIIDGSLSEDEENLSSENCKIAGNPILLLSVVNDELMKILQNSDCYSSEYVDRLKYLSKLIEICKSLEEFYTKISDMPSLCDVYLIHLEHIYYRMDPSMLISVSNQLTQKTFVADTSKSSSERSDSSSQGQIEVGSPVISSMCQVIYAHGPDRAKTRAILYQIYNLAMNDQWTEARNKFLMSHLQDTISQSDVSTQTLYNRAMVQLGLCAFRRGMIREAFTGLKELQSSGRAKELLSQGIILAKNTDRNLKAEQMLRRQLLPFHMHLSLELIECVFLTCSILLEVPYMASSEMSGRKKMVSRSLMYILRFSEKQPIVGPPETSRERLVSAAKSMQQADWKRCSELLLGIKVWNHFYNSEQVKSMLLDKVKEEAIKAYIFANRSLFASISLKRLSNHFELPENQIRRIVNRCIMIDDLKASWDLESQTLNLLPEQIPGSLKIGSMDLTDRITYLLEISDRLHDSKTSLAYLKDKVDHVLMSVPEHLLN